MSFSRKISTNIFLTSLTTAGFFLGCQVGQKAFALLAPLLDKIQAWLFSEGEGEQQEYALLAPLLDKMQACLCSEGEGAQQEYDVENYDVANDGVQGKLQGKLQGMCRKKTPLGVGVLIPAFRFELLILSTTFPFLEPLFVSLQAVQKVFCSGPQGP